jgi:Na+/H+ antiporter NhaB
MWFVGRGAMLAALAGAMIIFLNVASLGVLGSALTVAGVVAAVGLGLYLLWGRVFVRRAVRERQQIQERVTMRER